MNKFFVYALIDPETNSPFYIGKGSKNRPKAHFRPSSLKSRSRKNSKIKSLQAKGLQIKTAILFEKLTESEAKEKEIELIALYGRIDLGSGCLTNGTNGGDGTSGAIPYTRTDLHRQSLSEFAKTRTYSEDHRRAISRSNSGSGNGMFGVKHSAESRSKMKLHHANSKRSVGANNTQAKTIRIFDDTGKLRFTCEGNFSEVCRLNGLPAWTLAESYRNKGVAIKCKKNFSAFTGWRAEQVVS